MDIDTEALNGDVQATVANLTNNGLQNAAKTILIAVVLLIICLIVKKALLSVLDRGLDKGGIDKTFHAFIRSAANIVLLFVTVLIVAESLGINASSLLALMGIVGLAVSLSVQGSLSNLAGGITILVTKPFSVGDYVEIGDQDGVILQIGMNHTQLNTLDNRRVIIPNSTVVGAKVVNYATEPNRRVDFVFSAAYSAPAEQVKAVLMGVVEKHDKVLADPAPFVRMSKYGEANMEYTVRAWCRNADYWDVYFDIMEQVKPAFDEAGIEISYPHVNVQMKNA